MRLLEVKVKNFRLLKDLAITFAAGPDKNVTVIRAANESGKTTLLTALQWGLFGDEALPDRGRTFRFHPLDVSTAKGTRVETEVSIDYEVDTRSGSRRYRLIRSSVESVHGDKWSREDKPLQLFELNSTGADRKENPEAYIRPYLPSELREVLFTDGDRALSFIEGSRGEQSKRVEGAIRSLLGLGVLEDALAHVNDVGSALNRRAKMGGVGAKELEAVSDKIASIEEDIPELQSQLEETKGKVISLDDFRQDADARLTEALRKGNRQDLISQRDQTEKERVRAEGARKTATREQADLFKSPLLARQLLGGALASSKKLLDDLYNKGKIPNQTVPVLEERLEQAVCICGESLSEDGSDGSRRRRHICGLIEASRNTDRIQELVTALYYSSKSLLSPIVSGWKAEYEAAYKRRQAALASLQDISERYRALEAKIDSIPQLDISQLKASRDLYAKQHLEEVRKEEHLKAKLEDFKVRLSKYKVDQSKLLGADERGQKLAAELDVAEDLQRVLDSSLEAMKTRELLKVSSRMNQLFLKMIGADADQKERAVIQSAEITPEFRINVSGPNGRYLDPSQDLNGASRRALTLAFILALTSVSEVDAPNVIDTPLGMTSGYVKRSILSISAEQSGQLILFLTHDEIKGCEDILDAKAGVICTLTNPAHYPKILMNMPPVSDSRVIKCGCNHRQHCAICERRESGVVNEVA